MPPRILQPKDSASGPGRGSVSPRGANPAPEGGGGGGGRVWRGRDSEAKRTGGGGDVRKKGPNPPPPRTSNIKGVDPKLADIILNQLVEL